MGCLPGRSSRPWPLRLIVAGYAVFLPAGYAAVFLPAGYAAVFLPAGWAVAAPMIVDPGQGVVPLPGGTTGAAELSGITHVGGNRYLAVGDNGAKAVWHLDIAIDGATGRIASATVSGSLAVPGLGSDSEGIAYRAATGSVFVADEVASTIGQFDTVGGATLAPVAVPSIFTPTNVQGNFGLEALAFGAGGLWTANEEALVPDGPVSSTTAGSWVRIQRFDATLGPAGQWAYRTDPISAMSSLTTAERSGVVDVLPWDSATLLVLEREFGGAVPGFRSRLYGVEVDSGSDVSNVATLAAGGFTPLTKTLLWERSFSALAPSNFEGMSFGPLLADGSRSLLLVSDNGGGIRQDLYALVVVPEPAAILSMLSAALAGIAWRILRRRLGPGVEPASERRRTDPLVADPPIHG